MGLWLTPEAEQQIFDSQALKRKSYPEDVSRMALFLASNDSQMITGQSFIVDGGWSYSGVMQASRVTWGYVVTAGFESWNPRSYFYAITSRLPHN